MYNPNVYTYIHMFFFFNTYLFYDTVLYEYITCNILIYDLLKYGLLSTPHHLR